MTAQRELRGALGVAAVGVADADAAKPRDRQDVDVTVVDVAGDEEVVVLDHALDDRHAVEEILAVVDRVAAGLRRAEDRSGRADAERTTARASGVEDAVIVRGADVGQALEVLCIQHAQRIAVGIEHLGAFDFERDAVDGGGNRDVSAGYAERAIGHIDVPDGTFGGVDLERHLLGDDAAIVQNGDLGKGGGGQAKRRANDHPVLRVHSTPLDGTVHLKQVRTRVDDE